MREGTAVIVGPKARWERVESTLAVIILSTTHSKTRGGRVESTLAAKLALLWRAAEAVLLGRARAPRVSIAESLISNDSGHFNLRRRTNWSTYLGWKLRSTELRT